VSCEHDRLPRHGGPQAMGVDSGGYRLCTLAHAGEHNGLSLVVNLEHQLRSSLRIDTENRLEHEYHVDHEVHRIIPHDNSPRQIVRGHVSGEGITGRTGQRHSCFTCTDCSRAEAARWALSQSSKSRVATRHSRPNLTAGSSPERNTVVTTNVETSMYSQISATDNQGLSIATLIGSMCTGYTVTGFDSRPIRNLLISASECRSVR